MPPLDERLTDYPQEPVRPTQEMEDTVAADQLDTMSVMGGEYWAGDDWCDY